MNPELEKEVRQFADHIGDIHDEIESASQEGSNIEDIEGAKTLAADLIDRYHHLLSRLGPEEQSRVSEWIGPAVENVKDRMHQLKEAPE